MNRLPEGTKYKYLSCVSEFAKQSLREIIQRVIHEGLVAGKQFQDRGNSQSFSETLYSFNTCSG